jgi:hypothetical protein
MIKKVRITGKRRNFNEFSQEKDMISGETERHYARKGSK